MYRVVSVVDKKDSAIDRMAQGMKPYMTNIDYQVVAVHPKRPDPKQLETFERLARTADVIDWQYFRTAEMLREKYPWARDIDGILTHHNPYSIKESDWNSYRYVIANNKTILKDLDNITGSLTELIPNTVDPYFWKFNDEYTYSRSVIMVANRIEGKKGILPVAKACKEIGAKMYLVGAISDMNYWREVMEVGSVEFAQQITDEELRDMYYKSGIHVCNSEDGFESGTLPMLEAIFCGVPVLTRNIGHVPDIKTDDNLVVNYKTPDNVEHIAQLLNEMFSDKKKLDKMRNEAWFSIKDRNFERRAYMYQRLFRKLQDQPVSVVVPVADKPEVTASCLNAILNQTHPNIEIIVVDDGIKSQEEMINKIKQTSNVPIRYIAIGEDGYNLAQARNLGAIEATADTLVFCDQRIIMKENAIEEFLKELKQGQWLYGSKGVKKDFVENFSCILRDDFFTFGMFAQIIDEYGGMSQEARARARRQGMELRYIENAKATPEGKSSNRFRKKFEIMRQKNKLWKAGLQ